MMHSFSPKKNGRYGQFGGCFLPEGLIKPIKNLEKIFNETKQDKTFITKLNSLLKNYAGRPTPLTEVKQFSRALSGPRIFLKREDLLHTGAHKINNALGQCLLAKYMGKTRVIAETGAGQHGVATATACAYLNLPCEVYMGKIDIERQSLNLKRMQLLGAKVIPVNHGSKTLKDAVNEALRDWAENHENSYYCLGSALGPHPYPDMVAFFQSVIGNETKLTCLQEFNRLPNSVIACIGGGSNAIGIFQAFLNNETVKLIGVEAGGFGNQLGEHAARLKNPTPGVLHGCYSYMLQNDEGQVAETHSISAGLDYPMIGPQHAELFAINRASYVNVSDEEALSAFQLLSKTEGIIPALESSHALAYIIKTGKDYQKNDIVIINLSGRGDKDLNSLEKINESPSF